MKLYRNVADPNGICGICTAGIYSKWSSPQIIIIKALYNFTIIDW
jgi:hypothetical protein